MKWLKGFKDNLKKVHWTKTVGISKTDKTCFCVEFVSNPLSKEVFDKMSGKYLDKVYGSNNADTSFAIGFSYSLPSEVLGQAQKQLVLGLPKLRIANRKIKSKRLTGVKYELTKKGWVITQTIEGTLK